MHDNHCRHCNHVLTKTFLDLGSAPPSNAYILRENLDQEEIWLPLKVMVCEQCWLVQTLDFAGRENLFSEDYAYFSSFSSTWLQHAQNFVEVMQKRFDLTQDSLILEVAANDGYLLQYAQAALIPCYGIEPTTSTATAARAKGLTIIGDFFGQSLAQRLALEGKQVDLSVANNVLAHVPDINDFVAGFSTILKPDGVASFEFPHLLNLVRLNQFDTVYHEHYSYLSLTAISTIFEKQGLGIFDVEKLTTHGGSLRVLAQRVDTGRRPIAAEVTIILDEEKLAGIRDIHFYEAAQARAEQAKFDLLAFLLDAKKAGKQVAAYAAAAKGNTLLNFSGVRPDLISYVVDINPHKQGKYLPGSRIPILGLEALHQCIPDYLLILAWNLKDEVIKTLKLELGELIASRIQFVTAIPDLNFEVVK
ncbi:methyltransferase domain-containing protein [Undibacterium sp. Di24W]|uniref:methyltransferase domain-containing protein n=1 Tax=Undibacterium sp. Di24W TaxID=3413033 RepID=UPI003BF2DCEB